MVNNIILFDGVCHLCDRSVRFIIKRDKLAVYKFAAIQSDAGQLILSLHSIQENPDSLILVKGNKIYTKSSAVLRICKHLTGGWKLLYGFLMVPKPIRDFLYTTVAKNRYKWFGKKDSCLLPTPEIKGRFL